MKHLGQYLTPSRCSTNIHTVITILIPAYLSTPSLHAFATLSPQWYFWSSLSMLRNSYSFRPSSKITSAGKPPPTLRSFSLLHQHLHILILNIRLPVWSSHQLVSNLRADLFLNHFLVPNTPIPPGLAPNNHLMTVYWTSN